MDNDSVGNKSPEDASCQRACGIPFLPYTMNTLFKPVNMKGKKGLGEGGDEGKVPPRESLES